jgi:protease-4
MENNPNNPRDFYQQAVPPSQGASFQQQGANSPQQGGVYYYGVPVPQQRSWFASCFFFLLGMFAVFFFGCLTLLFFMGLIASAVGTAVSSSSTDNLFSPLSEVHVSGNRTAKDKIAILTISGTILGNDEGFIQRQINAVLKDRDVRAVVLRVNSPGGTISGSDYYLEQLKQMKKERDIPLIVSMGATAASGGYYVSMAGDELYAEPTTITGSIGVIFPMLNLAELCEKIGVQFDPITSGPYKSMGSMTRPLTEEERKIFQNIINDSFARFKDVIREGRSEYAQDPEKLDAIATGQIYTANQALENGLIDHIGFLEDACNRAIEMAGLFPNRCRVFKYRAKMSLLDLLMMQDEDVAAQTRLLKMVAQPQPYFIMPGVVPDVMEDRGL